MSPLVRVNLLILENWRPHVFPVQVDGVFSRLPLNTDMMPWLLWFWLLNQCKEKLKQICQPFHWSIFWFLEHSPTAWLIQYECFCKFLHQSRVLSKTNFGISGEVTVTGWKKYGLYIYYLVPILIINLWVFKLIIKILKFMIVVKQVFCWTFIYKITIHTSVSIMCHQKLKIILFIIFFKFFLIFFKWNKLNYFKKIKY